LLSDDGLRAKLSQGNRAKVEVGLARGKKQYDKRDTIKQRDTQKEIKRYLNRQ